VEKNNVETQHCSSISYVGFDPVEGSSAERKAYGGIRIAGSRLSCWLKRVKPQLCVSFLRNTCHGSRPTSRWVSSRCSAKQPGRRAR